jgi:sarcosine oxidase
MRGLAAWLERQGVALRFHESVLSINETAAGVELVTSRGTLRAEQVVICGGPWVSRLVPGLPARATRQHVGYWALGPSVGVGRFPAWVRLDDEGTHYGLPCFEAGLMKAAFHRTGFDDAVPDDPDTFADVSASAVRAVQDRLRAWFSLRIGEPIRLERCFYTNVAGDAFICRWAHERQRTFVVSACSGHAFKLAPYTAREVADLLLA